jgi:chromosomal replication initiation ATPase DnaA
MISKFSKAVCVPESDILGRKRGKISDIRETCWLLLFKRGYDYHAIGRMFGRTHSTVLMGVRRISGLLDIKDPEITKIYELTKNIKR